MNSTCCCYSTPPCIKYEPGCNTWDISWSTEAAADNISKSCLLNGTGCIPNPEQKAACWINITLSHCGSHDTKSFPPKIMFHYVSTGFVGKMISPHLSTPPPPPPTTPTVGQNAFKQLLCYSQKDSKGLLTHICLTVPTLCTVISSIDLEGLPTSGQRAPVAAVPAVTTSVAFFSTCR